jgi:hypothetical protein
MERIKYVINIGKSNIFWKIYRRINEQGVWRMRTNQELRELHKSSGLVGGIKKRMLEWLGYVT